MEYKENWGKHSSYIEPITEIHVFKQFRAVDVKVNTIELAAA